MRRMLPPFSGLRSFEAAARLGSFSAAAQELHVTHPIVGRQIRGLEDFLGVSLFHRDGRGQKLTDIGQAYYKSVSTILDDLSDATERVSSDRRTKKIRLVVTPGLMSRWLIRRLGSFGTGSGTIKLTLTAGVSPDAVSSGNYDVGIFFFEQNEIPKHAKKIVDVDVFPVCSPAYLAAHSNVRRAEDLLHCSLLHEDEGEWWTEWLAQAGVQNNALASIAYENAGQAIDMALRDQGVALVNRLLVTQELGKELVIPIDGIGDGYGYYYLTRQEEPLAHTRLFIKWLVREMSADLYRNH